MAYYIHNVPGRLRIKIPTIKGNPSKIQEVQDVLKKLEGVENAVANHLTGSVIAYYDPMTVDHEKILNLLNREGYLDEPIRAPEDLKLQKAALGVVQAVGKAIFSSALGKALEGSGLSFLAVLI